MCFNFPSLSAEKSALPQPPLNSCSRDSEHIYDTIPANTSHHYDVLEGPTLESDHELQDVSEEGDTRDKLRNCQDDFEVRERNNLFAHLTFKHCVIVWPSYFQNLCTP